MEDCEQSRKKKDRAFYCSLIVGNIKLRYSIIVEFLYISFRDLDIFPFVSDTTFLLHLVFSLENTGRSTVNDTNEARQYDDDDGRA